MEFKDEIISTPEEIKDFLNSWTATHPNSVFQSCKKGKSPSLYPPNYEGFRNWGRAAYSGSRTYETFRTWFDAVLNRDLMEEGIVSRSFDDPKTQKEIPFFEMVQCKLSRELEEIISPRVINSNRFGDAWFIKRGLVVSPEGRVNPYPIPYNVLIKDDKGYLIDLNKPVISRSLFDDKDFYLYPYVVPIISIKVPDSKRLENLDPKRKRFPLDNLGNLPKIIVEPHERENNPRRYYLFDR